MKVLHCTWIPECTDEFVQPGDFWLWIEHDGEPAGVVGAANRHPRHLTKAELVAFLEGELGLDVSPYERRFHFTPQTVPLPTVDGRPLPGPELESGADEEPIEAALTGWEVDGYRLAHPFKQLGELRFLSAYRTSQTKAGIDLLFWHYFTQSLKSVIVKDRYIPALLYRTMPPEGYEIYAGWEIVSDSYERLIREAVERMPPVCASAGGFFYESASLLKHCADVLVHRTIVQAASATKLGRKIEGTLLNACRNGAPAGHPWKTDEGIELYRQWLGWRRNLLGRREEADLELVFRLQEAVSEDDAWRLEILLSPRRDPALRLPLAEYWGLRAEEKQAFAKPVGPEFEKNLLLGLGQAARIYPKLWEGLDEERPTGVDLALEEAFAFLQEDAWVLEDAGFTVMVPTWWTPQGRRRTRIRLYASRRSPSDAGTRRDLGLQNLIAYRYELALGAETIDEAEWERLVESKTPLVRYRGQWLTLDREKMRTMLEFWRKHRSEDGGMSLPELMRKTAEDSDLFEIDPQGTLLEMLGKLRDHSQLQPVDDPPGLVARLRDYQRRGLAWLCYLESLGLNGCLADDMGLGKTVQVIARLVHERVETNQHAPTLLVVPTSVIGNWKKELERFAPGLRAIVHHGGGRFRDVGRFREICAEHDAVITSYALVRRDEKLFSQIRWARIVLDEAQNIKNPLSAQTKAVLRLNAEHRLALTGTPVENRLLDLWSIFNFLNPGYLGKQTQFRQRYELPIQRDNDPAQTETLKQLIEPFVLRRVKTDPNIIKDLPDKVENKQFCHLCKEQASLYEAVVRDVEQRLTMAEGIGRQGLMLSALMRLKQVCNHPAQFLRDGSEFTPERSPKLDRLHDMLTDVIAETESALVFTQFAEVGESLYKYLRDALGCPVFYLHGGTPPAKRERMISEFQDPDTEPGVFILSLKAGGVGITLTKANHVFHFDRWWNPAVEDQATDRAFRIGQCKNVFVHKFITIGTLEERIDRMIEDKKQVASLIVGNDESWLTRLDNEAFKELIALNRQAVME
ncbi:MAG: DEAD/DEAH box helicase [Methylocaldum sp.]|nr:DEAD/DEAH box helicase [Methylocaldum sp.]